MPGDRDALAPLKMISIIVSDGCELARWLLQRAGLPFVEELHAPFLHMLATLRVRGGLEVPVVVTPTGVWTTLAGLAEAIDARSPPGRKVFGETEAERLANAAFLQKLMDLSGAPLRRYVYRAVLPNKRSMYPLASYGAPAWERAVVYWFYPIWRRLLMAALGDTPEQRAAAPRLIEQSLAMVESELAARGGPFLAGAAPGGVDIVVAAVLSPAVFPPEYGGKYPRLEDVPQSLRDFILAVRARPAGRLVLETYARERQP
jgi:glutathione S-transferase